MNIKIAAYRTVHECAGGPKALAAQMERVDRDGNTVEMSPVVLRSKVSLEVTTHRLALDEADLIMALTGDHRILHALAATHGYQLLRTAAAPEHGSLMQRLLKANSAEGEVDRVLEEALADGVVTPNELKAVVAAELARQAASTALLSKLHQMCEARAAA